MVGDNYPYRRIDSQKITHIDFCIDLRAKLTQFTRVFGTDSS